MSTKLVISNSIKIFGVIVTLIILVLIDLRYLIKPSYPTRAILVYSFIMAINLVVSILLINQVEIISPAMILEKFVRIFVPGEPVQ